MEATPTTFPELRGLLRGDLLDPSDSSYDDARRVYNGMIDRHPEGIVRCADVADVIAAVGHARRQGLPLAVRCGGHNAAGLGVCDGGLVVDLCDMNGVRVDPQARTVRVEGGATWGDVDHAAHAFGLAVPSGIISTTGIGGLTLGGGHGYLSRKYGLAIDNLLEADVVLADGRLVTANEDEHPDLFWAIRGGGGNFGVVTSFLFQAHPVDTVFAGPMLWPMDQAEDVMQWYRDFMPEAPRTRTHSTPSSMSHRGRPSPSTSTGGRCAGSCGATWAQRKRQRPRSSPLATPARRVRARRTRAVPDAQQRIRPALSPGPPVVLEGRFLQRARR